MHQCTASPEVFGGSLPVPVRTAAASAAAALWRIGLTPLDTVKTTLQVEGGDRGYEQVLGKIKADGATVLYQARAPTRLASAAGAGTSHPRRDHPGPSAQGALGNALATFVGSYPWYLTFNTLNEAIPLPEGAELATKAAAPRLARPPTRRRGRVMARRESAAPLATERPRRRWSARPSSV